MGPGMDDESVSNEPSCQLEQSTGPSAQSLVPETWRDGFCGGSKGVISQVSRERHLVGTCSLSGTATLERNHRSRAHAPKGMAMKVLDRLFGRSCSHRFSPGSWLVLVMSRKLSACRSSGDLPLLDR